MTFPGRKKPVMRIPEESMEGAFLKIGLPSMEQLKPIYGRLLMLSAMEAMENLAKTHLGEITVVWLHKAVAVQIHKAEATQAESLNRIERFYDALSNGLNLKMDGKTIELHWANKPPVAVLEQGSDRDLSGRFIRTDSILDAMEKHGARGSDLERRIILSLDFQTPTERLRDQANDWRRQQALQDALVNQGLRLTFREVRSTVTGALLGFNAKPQPFEVPGADREVPKIDSVQMWALAKRTGATDELALTFIRLALNHLRVWRVLMPNNDMSLTIEVFVDSIVQNQERLNQMLKDYQDVSDALTIAFQLTDDSRSIKEMDVLGATLNHLHQSTETRFALAEMGFNLGRMKVARTLDTQVTHLSGQWAEARDFYTKTKPIVQTLVQALHRLRSEVVAPNVNPETTPIENLVAVGIDAYELRPAPGEELLEDQAIMKIKTQQETIADTVINAQFRFRQAT